MDREAQNIEMKGYVDNATKEWRESGRMLL